MSGRGATHYTRRYVRHQVLYIIMHISISDKSIESKVCKVCCSTRICSFILAVLFDVFYNVNPPTQFTAVRPASSYSLVFRLSLVAVAFADQIWTPTRAVALVQVSATFAWSLRLPTARVENRTSSLSLSLSLSLSSYPANTTASSLSSLYINHEITSQTQGRNAIL